MTMVELTKNFSSRKGYSALEAPVSVVEGAPDEIRRGVLHFALDAGLTPKDCRTIVLQVLGVPPESKMWTVDRYVKAEAYRHLEKAHWFEIYDIAESFLRELETQESPKAREDYAMNLNRLFLRLGVGWKIEDGIVKARGSESFESQIARAKQELESKALDTARQEMHESLVDLSRRPTPDLTGAIQHAAAALECVAREVSDSRNLTLGKISKKHPELFPSPLGLVVEKIWGFSSEHARHLREGSELKREEVELVVSLSAAAITYLAQKLK